MAPTLTCSGLCRERPPGDGGAATGGRPLSAVRAMLRPTGGEAAPRAENDLDPESGALPFAAVLLAARAAAEVVAERPAAPAPPTLVGTRPHMRAWPSRGLCVLRLQPSSQIKSGVAAAPPLERRGGGATCCRGGRGWRDGAEERLCPPFPRSRRPPCRSCPAAAW